MSSDSFTDRPLSELPRAERRRRRKERKAQREHRHRIALWGIRILRFVPEPVGRALAWLGGTLLARLDPGRHTVAANLRTAFPGRWTDAQLHGVTRDFYVHALGLGFELTWLEGWSRGELVRRFDIIGLNHLDEALAGGKGVILVTAHMGNWEASGAVAAALGYPVKAVSRMQGQGEVESYLQSMRTRHGLGLIADTSPLDCLKALRRNQVLALMIDGRARKSAGVQVPFLGSPFPCVSGPAILALKTGAPVLFFSSERLSGGRFRGTFRPLPTLRTGDEEQDVWLNSALYQRALEDAVRACPTQHLLWRARLRKYDPEPLYEERVRSEAWQEAQKAVDGGA